MAIKTTTNATQESYGPGTYVEESFSPLPEECRRLLRVFAARTPGFTKDEGLLSGVQFHGDDLPCIPGPIKSQAVTAVLHAMVGIVGLEILHLRGTTNSTITHVDTNHAGLYPATQFAPWSSDIHVAPLYYQILKAWGQKSDLIEDEKYYVHFSDSVFGDDLRVLAPIVKYDEEEMTPKWTSPPVPFCHHKYRSFSEQ